MLQPEHDQYTILELHLDERLSRLNGSLGADDDLRPPIKLQLSEELWGTYLSLACLVTMLWIPSLVLPYVAC